MNRRGVVYLIIAVLLLSVFLTVLFAQRLPTSRELAESESVRIRTMSDFLHDFLADIHRATYIAGFRSFIAVEQYIAQEGATVAEPAPLFIEAFLNGTIDEEPYEIMANSTFGEYLERVNAEAGGIGIRLNVSVANVTLAHRTPWSVDITFLMDLEVEDVLGLARWELERDFTTEVSILDIRDPVYSVHTLGRMPNTIRRSPHNDSSFLVGGNDTTALADEIANMYYREDPGAPSFLQRLAGNLSGRSKYGIASLVDLDELDAQGLPIKGYRSVVDHRYFANGSTTNYCPGKGEPLPAWFKIHEAQYLDEEHDYAMQELNATVC